MGVPPENRKIDGAEIIGQSPKPRRLTIQGASEANKIVS